MRSIAGVEDAALAIALPGTGEDYPGEFSIEGHAPGPKTFADLQSVSPDFFRLMRIPILAGETCRFSADEKLPDTVLVNRTFADQFLAGENPVGRRVKLTWTTAEIKGVTGDIRDHGYAHDPRPTVYSCGFPGFYPDPAFLLKTRADASHMIEPVRRKLQELEPNRAVYSARPLTEMLHETLAEKRFQTALLALFGGTALVLAMVGLYGVMSFFVSQRGREMGLRAALGARPGQILAHVFRQGAWMTAAGVALGIGAAAAAARSLETLLFGVTPWDPLAFALGPTLLVVVAALATWIPARRATHIDPMAALKDE
jgi:predicted permease